MPYVHPMTQVPYTIVFEFPGMHIHGAGPVATVDQVDGVLPGHLHHPHDTQGYPIRGTWLLTGTDDGERLAFYELQPEPDPGE